MPAISSSEVTLPHHFGSPGSLCNAPGTRHSTSLLGRTSKPLRVEELNPGANIWLGEGELGIGWKLEGGKQTIEIIEKLEVVKEGRGCFL